MLWVLLYRPTSEYWVRMAAHRCSRSGFLDWCSLLGITQKWQSVTQTWPPFWMLTQGSESSLIRKHGVHWDAWEWCAQHMCSWWQWWAQDSDAVANDGHIANAIEGGSLGSTASFVPSFCMPVYFDPFPLFFSLPFLSFIFSYTPQSTDCILLALLLPSVANCFFSSHWHLVLSLNR